MKLVLDEWIVREVIDTLYMAHTTLLGITGLDSPKEVAEKSANETAITRRISKAIDIIRQSEQSEPFSCDYENGSEPKPEGIEAVVHHCAGAHYLATNTKQLNARLKQFDEGAKVLVYIKARKEE